MNLPPSPSADRFEDLPQEEQNAVRAASQQMLLLAYRYVVPLTLCHPSDRIVTASLNNGTASVIRHEGQHYAITAAHVVQFYRKRLDDGESVDFRLANLSVPMEERLAWQDLSSDIAVIRLSETETVGLGVFVSEVLDFSTIEVPPQNTAIICSGFPLYLRDDGTNTVEYGAQGMVLTVTRTGTDYFYCQFEREQWIDAFGGGIPAPGAHLGGLSGAPVFAIRDLHWPLIGIVTEFQESFELLRVQSLRSLVAWSAGSLSGVTSRT